MASKKQRQNAPEASRETLPHLEIQLIGKKAPDAKARKKIKAALNNALNEMFSLVDDMAVGDLITVSEAAKIRNTSRAGIYQLINRQRIQGVEFLGRMYVYRSEIENFMKEKPGPKADGDKEE